MKNINIEEVKRYLKRSLKKKVKITTSLIVLFMMSNSIGLATAITIDSGKIGSWGSENTSKGSIALNPKGENDSKVQYQKVKDYSIAIGLGAEAENADSISIGHNANSESSLSVSIGKDANTKMGNSVAIGAGSKVYDFDNDRGTGGSGQGVAVGSNARAVSQATSLGNDTYAIGNSSIAIGSDDIDIYYKDIISEYDYKKYFKKLYDKIDNSTNPKYGFSNHGGKLSKYETAKYSPTLAQGKGSIAIGSRSIAYADGATALGTLAFALKEKSTALGTHTRAEGVGAIAIGNDTKIFSDNSVGAGNNIQILKKGGMGFGHDIISGGENSISIGTKVYSNVKTNSLDKGIHEAYKKDKNDFIFGSTYIQDNLEQLNQTLEKRENNSNLGHSKSFDISKKEHNGVANVGENNGSKNAITIGTSSMASSENSIGIGHGTFSISKNSMALGSYSYVNGENSLGLGVYSKVFSKNSIAIGTGSGVAYDADNSLVMGVASYSKGMNGLVFGNKSKVTVKDGLAIGSNSEANLTNSTAVGVNSKTDYTKEDLEKEGYAPKGVLSMPSTENVGVISVGSKGAERRIVNVAPGYRDSDAVNVSQLKYLEEKINQTGLIGAEEKNSNNEIHYLSIDKNGDGSKGIEKIVQKQRDYNEYIEYKNKQLEIKARVARGDQLPEQYKKKINEKVIKIEEKYKNDTSFTQIELKKITDEEIDKIKNGNASFDNIITRINEAKEKDKYITETDENGQQIKKLKTILSDAEIKNINESNYNNKGAVGKDSIAFGYQAKSTGDKGIAIGKEAKANGEQSVVIGTPNNSNNGQDDEIRANIGEISAGKSSVSIGNGVKSKDYSVGIGGNVVAGTTAVAIGDRTRAIGNKSIAIGNEVKALAEDSYVFGGKSEISKDAGQSSAIGYKVVVKSSQAVAIGNDVFVDKDSRGAIAIGSDDSNYNEGNNKENGSNNYTKTKAKGNATTAIGAHAQATNIAATALGARAFATEKETVAVGANSKASVKDAVAIGSYSLADQQKNDTYYNPVTGKDDGSVADKLATKAALSIGDVKNKVTRQIIGLAAGTNDTDAVNVWQLKQLKEYFDENKNFKLEGDNNKEQTFKLQNKLEIKGNTAKKADSKPEEWDNTYTVENVQTFVTQDNKTGKTSVLIGLRKDPRFDKVTVGGENKTEITESGINITKKDNNGDKTVKFGIDNDGNATITDARNTAASKIVTENTLGAQKISYTATNGTATTPKKETTLTKGFDFASEDLEIKAENDGKVTFKLSDKVKNSLNGKDLTTKVNALRNGEAGTVVYTDSEGNRLVKANNGKYYKSSQVGEDGQVKVGADGQGIENPELRLVNAEGETTTPITLGNVTSALGLSKNDAENTKKRILNKLINKEAKDNLKYTEAELNKVVTLRDLQFLASKGITFIGSTGRATKFLGDRININKSNSIGGTFDTKYETKNIAVKVDDKKGDIEVGLAKELTKINSITSEKDVTDNTQTKITLSKEGATFGVEKETFVNKQLTTEQVGVKTKIDKNGISITEKDKKDPSVSIKESSIEFETSVDNKGTGSITGLKDLDETSEGHRAVNKNYVDEKITELEGKKLGFTGNSGPKIEKKLGEEIAIKGDDSSITTEAKDNAITIKVKDKGITENKLADDLLTKIEAGNTAATNTITLSGDNGTDNKPTKTSDEALNKNGGINFSITGEDGLKTTASGTNVKIGMTDDLKNKINKLNNLENTYATKKELGDKANKTLDNITDDGKKVIKDIAKDAVEVTSDTNSGINVETTKDTDKTTYKLSLDGDKIKDLAGTKNIATEYAKVDGSNLTGLDDAKKQTWATGIGISSISDTTKDQLVTDTAVKNYLKTEIEKVNKNIGDQTIAYKANSNDGTKKTTSLKYGFDFTSTDLDIKTEDNGKVIFELSDKVKNSLNGKGNDGRDGKTGNDSAGSKGLTGKDGLNGKDLTTKVNALRNGEAGTVVYTDKDGNRLVKANDGKYYKSSEVETNGTTKANAQEVENPELRLVDAKGETTTPITLGNLESALGLKGTNDNKNIINKLVGNNETDKFDEKELNRAVTLKDLQYVAKQGLTFEANYNADNTGTSSINKMLGETLSITASGAENGKYAANNANYTGTNLATYVKTDNDGKKKFYIGMKETPTFKSINIGSTGFGAHQTDKGKGDITADDKGLKLSYDNASVTISKDGDKAKISGLKDADINEKTYGTEGVVATQKEVKDVLNKINANGTEQSKLKNGTLGTLVYTDKNGNKLMKDGDGKFYKANEDGTKEKDAKEVESKDVILSTVKSDGKTTEPITLGNVASALGLSKDKKDTNKEILNKLVNKEAKQNLEYTEAELNKVVTLRDLQFLAKQGITFAGSVGTATKFLGDTITINGSNSTDLTKDNFATKYETKNIAVKVDNKTGNIEVGLAKELSKINSITSDEDANDKTKTKITLSKDGATFGVEKDVVNGKNITTQQVGVKTTIGKDGINITKKDSNTPDISIKAGDDNNGPSINFVTKEEVNGTDKKTVGTGKISGLADLTKDSDGHMAANKNYVDEQVKKANNKVTEVEKKVTQNTEKITAIENSIKTQNDNITKIQNDVNTNKTNIQNNTNNINTNKRNITNNTANIEKNTKEISDIKTKIEGLKDNKPFEYFEKSKDGVFGSDGKIYPKGTVFDKDGKAYKDVVIGSDNKVYDKDTKEIDGKHFKESDKVTKQADGKYYTENEIKDKKYDEKAKTWLDKDGKPLNSQPTEASEVTALIDTSSKVQKPVTETKLIRGKDNKFYTESDLEGAKYENGKYTKNGSDVLAKNPNDVIIKAMPNSEAMSLGNIGVGRIEKGSTDAINGGQLHEELSKKLNVDGSNIDQKEFAKNASKGADISKPNDILVTDKQVSKHLTTNYYNKTEVNKMITTIDKKADIAIENSNLALGGVANAVAMANLVQVSSNSTHRHNLSAAYGYYGKSHALAIGFSGINKENNFVYKLSGSVNNQGNLALGIGAGVMLGETNDYKERKDTNLMKKELDEANKKIADYEEKQKKSDEKIKSLEQKQKVSDDRMKELEKKLELLLKNRK